MDLREATGRLARAPDVGKWLRLADNYIQAYNKLGNSFVLPADHALLRPVIESFAADPAAFVAYIRALRDGADGTAYDDLHELYRTISMRVLQTERRARIRKAVVVLTKACEKPLGRPLAYDDQLKVARFVETQWGNLRLEHLAAERRLRNTKRLSSEERNIALEGFWRGIDAALERDDVPLGSAGIEQLLESLSR